MAIKLTAKIAKLIAIRINPTSQVKVEEEGEEEEEEEEEALTKGSGREML